MRLGALALALSFAIAAPVRAEVTYHDYLACAAIYQSRLDYAEGLGLSERREAEDLRAAAHRFLRAAYATVPRGMVPCSRWKSAKGNFGSCALSQILRPQFAALQEQALVDLVMLTDGSGPLPACHEDPRCAACAALADPKAMPSGPPAP